VQSATAVIGEAMLPSEDEWFNMNMQNRFRQLGKPQKESKEEILKYHRIATAKQIEHENMIASGLYMSIPLPVMSMPGFATSQGWRNRRPPKESNNLKVTRIDNLKLGEVNKGCIVYGELCEPPMACGGDHAVYTIMQDLDNPDSIVKVSFHSGVQSCTCKEALLEFPIGTRLGIQEPLFKVYMDGTTGIRVDDMNHIFGDLSNDTSNCKSRTRWDPPRQQAADQSVPSHADTCNFCGLQAASGHKLKSCTACRTTLYCSSKCQKADWKQHKLVCTAEGKNLNKDGTAEDSTNPTGITTKGFYQKDNDLKVARKPLSTMPDARFRWSTSLWAVSPPKISPDGRIATNENGNSVLQLQPVW